MSQSSLDDVLSTSRSDVSLYLTAIEYTEQNGRPITHLFGRDEDRARWHVEVDGHRPSFFIRESAYTSQVDNHYAVYTVERTDDGGNRYTDLHGNPLVRVYTYIPKQVADMREHFDETWEADVFYTNRWLIDADVYTGVRIELPEGWGSDADNGENHVRVSIDDVTPDEPPSVDPRTIIVDIEVAGESGMPDESTARWPVSSIVAYDSYEDDYVGWMLEADEWDVDAQSHPAEFDDPNCYHDEMGFDAVRVFEDETDLLDDVNDYIERRRPDLLSGWHSNGFDYPYLINRCRNLDVWSFKEWSPIGDVYTSSYGPVVKGVEPFDMLDGYGKTKRGEFSGKLDDVAMEELDESKIHVDESHTSMWKNDPVEFLEYNKRDVELVKRIEAEQSIIDLFERIRTLTGAQFGDCHANIDLLDVLFLRKAKEYGYRLPTSTPPDRSWFYGAAVLDPKVGLHENVVYFDLSSLYPNAIKQLNIGPETLVGFDDDYDGDTVHSYVDDRPVETKQESDPSPSSFQYVSPDEQRSFIATFVDDVISLKEPYSGTDMYTAVKMVVNSIWGVLGDGDSYGTGFRLFDWRMGESITLFGRRVLQFTKDRAIEELEDRGYSSYAVVGDSVPADEPVLTDRGVVRADEVEAGDAIWTDDGFETVVRSIEKPLRKDCYTVRTYEGVTHVTEDHSLLLEDGTEVTPDEVTPGDRLLQHGLEHVDLPDHVDVSDDVAWLWGFFAAEGSCNEYEYDHRPNKTPFAINGADNDLLERAGAIFDEQYGISTTIRDTMASSGANKLQIVGNETGVRSELAREWHDVFYSGGEKRVPPTIFEASTAAKRAFIEGYAAGDGYDDSSFDYSLSTKSKLLAHGVTLLLKDLGYETTIDYRRNGGSEYYRIRTPQTGSGGRNVVRDVEPYDYDGDTVYDFETANGHFQAGIGSIIVHNTDGIGIAVNEDDYDDLVDVAHDVAEAINDSYAEFTSDEFDTDENHMDVEVESIASKLFVPRGATTDNPKKRYAQRIVWDDDHGFLDEPTSKITGLEYVRSDTSHATAAAQKKFVDTVLDKPLGEAKESYYRWLKEYVNDIRRGEVGLAAIGRPKGMQKQPAEYGSPTQTPMPTYRGAKYANEFIYEGDALQKGDKPLLYYVDAVGGDYPVRYPRSWDTKEAGTTVDAIAVADAADVPDAFSIDVETMIDKTLRRPLTRLFDPLGWNFDDALADTDQIDITEFM